VSAAEGMLGQHRDATRTTLISDAVRTLMPGSMVRLKAMAVLSWGELLARLCQIG
jgi:hypothetical protein